MSDNLFDNLVFCISGTMSTMTRSQMSNLIEEHGGVVKKSVTNTVTHLITTESEISSETKKVEKALSKDIFIVSEHFVHDSISSGVAEDEEDYSLKPQSTKRKKKKKTTPKKKKKKKPTPKKSTKRKRAPSDTSDLEPPTKKAKVGVTKDGIPFPDPASGHQHDAHIYVSDGEIWNCMLNQTNIGRNNNKFYQIQLLELNNKNGFFCFTRWGRVGVTGQKACKQFATLESAQNEFVKKFKAKTGNNWENRHNFIVKNKKYTMLDISYAVEDEDVEMEDEIPEIPACTLDTRVQDFIKRISDISGLTDVMKQYQIDLTKMPLGKLSKEQIDVGFSLLGELEEALMNGSREDIEDLCNQFYTNIPHVYGMRRLPVIDNLVAVKQKRMMMDDLRDVAIASKIINVSRKQKLIDPVTSNYNLLNCEINPIEKDEKEYSLIEKYVKNTHGPTHSSYKLKLREAFRIDRKDEREKYEKYSTNIGNKRLLWHGSRITNFMGILSEGLRIAPPSAPVTGYMFGKGIYFADMVSKSANYCNSAASGNVGALLLCEVALGKQLKKNAATSLTKKMIQRQNCDSTWGKGGSFVPNEKESVVIDGVKWPLGKTKNISDPSSSLLYNEFIVYDTKQVNLKYLVLCDFV